MFFCVKAVHLMEVEYTQLKWLLSYEKMTLTLIILKFDDHSFQILHGECAQFPQILATLATKFLPTRWICEKRKT